MTANIAFYAIAQVSTFVPPGSVRVGSNEVTGLPNVAFRRPDGRVVLLLANNSEDLKRIALKQGKRTFPLTLPAHAVGTVVW